MPLSPGTRLGPYEVLASIGAGGMGEVYRARDSKLKREVAIKVLPSHLAGSPDLLARFEREAQAVAALTHPNILAIHDFGKEGGVSYAVMELLEGETLHTRLEEGALPTSKAFGFALQMARGLAAAHDKGVVHRDLKPENIFVTAGGQIKILDFGLAQVEDSPLEGDAESHAPTAARGTTPGSVLGTVGYMSPEQVRGRETDYRSDIFSFGVVLYEMLSGQRAFKRGSAVETMNAILKEDPPELSTVNERLTPSLDRIIHHCLEKKPGERFHSAHDLAFALETALGSSRRSGGEPVVASRSILWHPSLVAVLFALAVPVTFGLGWWFGVRTLPSELADVPVSFTQITDQPGVERSPSLSPDGRSFLFVSNARGNNDIYLQRVGGRNPINLTESSLADDDKPVYSPDGERIAFQSGRDGGGVFVMGSTGESVKRVADFGYDPAWSPDGNEIVVSTAAFVDPAVRTGTAELWVIDVTTGEKSPINRLDAMQPSWSPHGNRIAFWGIRDDEGGQRDLFTAAADGSEVETGAVPVTDDLAFDWSPVWSPDGRHLFFSSDRGGTMNLWRIPIDETSGRALGEPEPVTTPSRWSGGYSLSQDGRRMAYASLDRQSSLIKFSFDAASGSIVGNPVSILEGSRLIRDQSISPDGEWVAFTSWGEREDLFVVRTDGTDYRQLTDDTFRDRGVSWSPDGEQITFYSDRVGRYETWAIHPDGSGLEQLSRTSGPSRWYPLWSPDGARIATTDGERAWLTEMTPPLDERRGEPLPAIEEALVFWPLSWSPDGRFIAGMGFRPDGSLPLNVYLYSLDSADYEKLPDTASWPVWLSDSRHLLVIGEDGDIRRHEVQSGQEQPVLSVGERDVSTGRRFSISKDDRWLSLTKTTMKGDIWLLNFEQ